MEKHRGPLPSGKKEKEEKMKRMYGKIILSVAAIALSGICASGKTPPGKIFSAPAPGPRRQSGGAERLLPSGPVLFLREGPASPLSIFQFCKGLSTFLETALSNLQTGALRSAAAKKQRPGTTGVSGLCVRFFPDSPGSPRRTAPGPPLSKVVGTPGLQLPGQPIFVRLPGHGRYADSQVLCRLAV